MSLAVIDDKGRVVIPSKIRRRLGLRKGDALIVLEAGEGVIVLKKLDIQKLVREIAEEVAKAGIDLEELGREVEEEANRVAEKKIHGRH